MDTQRILLIFLIGFINFQNISAQTMHILVTGDDQASDIAAAVKVDQYNMAGLLNNIGDYFDEVINYSVESSSLSLKNLNETIGSMDPEAEDLLVFYYSGHGDRSNYPESPWPQLRPANGESIEVRDVLGALNRHMVRQVVVIIDACNGAFKEAPDGTRSPASSLSESAVHQLFKDFRGNVVVTSSKPGLVSYTLKNNHGSLFTYAFVATLEQELSKPETDWNQVLSQTQSIVVNSGGKSIQTPKYRVTPQ